MDIFTTVLTRVVQAPIKPARLRVKALVKEPATNELTDDIDHLENHEQYVDLSKDESKNKQNKKQHEETLSATDNGEDKGNDSMSPVITHKEEFIHPKKNDDKPDDIHHLDLFV